jgi:polysaccharide export outer membrane protein
MRLLKTLFILFLLLTAGGCGYIGGKKDSTLSSQDKSFTPSPVPPQSGESGQQEQILIEQTESRIVPTDKDYIIGPEDVLKIQVWDNSDLERRVQVSREGIFSFPLIGTVKASGLSVAQLEEELIKRLADGYLINPHVTITIEEYKNKKVFVLGEVHKPGTYYLTGRTDLLDVISQAGGQTEDAGDEIIIIRPQNNLKKEAPTMPNEAGKEEIITLNLYRLMRGDVTLNIDLQKGDTVFVPKMSYFYVYGEVDKPGRYNLEKGTTVLKGIAMAGGLTEKASKWRIKIIREKDGARIEIKAKMDQLLEPEDIISVPESFF